MSDIKQEIKDEVLDEWPCPAPSVSQLESGEIDDVRAVSPPVVARGRLRSRSRSVETRSQAREIPDVVVVETKRSTNEEEYTHSTFHVQELMEADLKESIAQRLLAVQQYVRAAVEAFHMQRHVLISTDDYDGRRQIEQIIMESVFSDRRSVFYVVRNGAVAYGRWLELAAQYTKVRLLAFNSVVTEETNCFILPIQVFRYFVYCRLDYFVGATVIFEDFDYIGNPDSGSCWEEAFLNLPQNSSLLFLLPRISNAEELARWIATYNICSVDCIVKTSASVMPKVFITLNHIDSSQLFQIMDDHGDLMVQNIYEAQNMKEHTYTQRFSKKSDIKETANYFHGQPYHIKLIRTLKCLNSTPILIHSFDTEDCDRLANEIMDMNFLSPHEQIYVGQLFDSEIARLPKKEQGSHIIEILKKYFQRGIGTYHAGMVVFLRDLMVFLFRKGLLKVVIGDHSIINNTNLRFTSVVLTQPRVWKSPGCSQWIPSVEYRKIVNRLTTSTDSPRILILVLTSEYRMTAEAAVKILQDEPPRIESQLKISAIAVVNAMYSSAHSYASLSRNTLLRFQRKEKAKRLQKELNDISYQTGSFTIDQRDELDDYNKTLVEYETKKEILRQKLTVQCYYKFLEPGRVIKVRMNDKDFGYGVVIKALSDSLAALISVTEESVETRNVEFLQPVTSNAGIPTTMATVRLEFKDIAEITSFRTDLPKDLTTSDAVAFVQKMVNMRCQYLGGTYPELPFDSMLEGQSSELKNLSRTVQKLERRLNSEKKKIEKFDEDWPKYKGNLDMLSRLDELDTEIEKAQCKDIDERIRYWMHFLSQLGYFEDNGELTSKAHFCLNLNVRNPELVTELLYSGFYKDEGFIAEDLAKLLSATVTMEVVDPKLKLPSEDKTMWKEFEDKVQTFVSRLRKAQIITPLEPTRILNSYNFLLFPLFDKWLAKHSFFDVCKNTKVRPGYVSTYVRRLDHLLVSIQRANKLVGESFIEDEQIKKTRDIYYWSLAIISRVEYPEDFVL